MHRFTILPIFIIILLNLTVSRAQTATDSLGLVFMDDLSQQEEVFIPEISDYSGYFSRMSDFGFSFLRYRVRGYGASYGVQRYMGLRFDDFWRGVPYWGAMNGAGSQMFDRFTVKGIGYDPVGVGIGSVAYDAEIYTKSRWQPRLRVGYSFSNRTYTNRAMVTYQNQELPRGWFFGGEIMWRGGRSLSIDGVFANNLSATLNGGKTFGKRKQHNLALTLLFSPSERANPSPTTQEAYDLTGNNLYNPNWGWQNNRQRAARTTTTVQPVAILAHNWRISHKVELYTSAVASYGYNAYSTLNWQKAPNPTPDYYRYMPSFEKSPEAIQKLKHLWATDQSVSQIDFSQLYYYNRVTSSQAHYIIEERIREPLIIGGQSTLQTLLSGGKLNFSAGIEAYYTQEKRYKKINDLLGADYWVDIDYFTESDDDYSQLTQNNTAQPNRKVHTGDTFGYNYSLTNLNTSLWLSARYRIGERLFVSLAGEAGYRNLFREGFWEKEMFLGNKSLGRSANLTSWEYQLKASVEYRLGAKFAVSAKVMLASKAPLAQNTFFDADYRNALIPNLKNEQITSAEVDLNYVTSDLRLMGSLYFTTIQNATSVQHFYSDYYSKFTDLVIKNINTRYMGVELSAEVRLVDDLWLQAATAISDNRYTNNPQATAYYKTTGEKLGETTLQYENKFCSPAPQALGSLSLAYQPYGWSISLTLNGFTSSYATLSPARYMPETIKDASDPIAFTNQEQLPSGVTVDLFGGKTFRFSNGSMLNIYAGINNITNSRGIITYAYQSSRLKRESYRYTPRDNRMLYALGVNGFLSISFVF